MFILKKKKKGVDERIVYLAWGTCGPRHTCLPLKEGIFRFSCYNIKYIRMLSKLWLHRKRLWPTRQKNGFWASRSGNHYPHGMGTFWWSQHQFCMKQKSKNTQRTSLVCNFWSFPGEIQSWPPHREEKERQKEEANHSRLVKWYDK